MMLYVGGGFVPLRVAVLTTNARRWKAVDEGDAVDAFEDWCRKTGREAEIGEDDPNVEEPSYELFFERIPGSIEHSGKLTSLTVDENNEILFTDPRNVVGPGIEWRLMKCGWVAQAGKWPDIEATLYETGNVHFPDEYAQCQAARLYMAWWLKAQPVTA